MGHPTRKCQCTPMLISRYRDRISGPLWDRFDLVVDVPHVPIGDLEGGPQGEDSEAVRRRVEAARAFQVRRTGRPFVPAGRLAIRDLPAIAALPAGAKEFLRAAASRLSLSARAVHRALRVARTLADLGHEERLSLAHVAEALQYRAPADPS